MPDLLRLLRALPGDQAAVEAALAGVDWPRLRGAAKVHGTSAVVWDAVSQARLDMPASEVESLRHDAAQVSAMTMRTRALALRALDTFAAAGVTPVFIKGPGLATRIYAEPLSRPSTDVDFLVTRADANVAERALRSLGLSSIGGVEEAFMRAHHHAVQLERLGGIVELHFDVLGVDGLLDVDSLCSRSKLGSFEGRPTRFLAPEDELIKLAEHAAGHLMVRLTWLFDIKLFLRKYPDLDWRLITTRARATGVNGPVYYALEAAQRLVGAVIAPSVIAGLRPSRWQAALAPRMFDAERLERRPALNKYVAHAYTSLLGSDLRHIVGHATDTASRALRRKIAVRFPALFPDHWRG